ncbi:MAG: hypothetical protein KBC73_24570 [Burkholderiaceae bacterium]|nr:hypothetical protein [Burkholderiaceae bacterium]
MSCPPLIRRARPGLAALLPLLAAAAMAAPAERFTTEGLGKAVAGQSLAQLERLLGQPLTAAGAASAASASASAAPAGCQLRSAAGQPGVHYALRQGLLTRVETRDPRWPSSSGVQVGDGLARVRQVYGARLIESPHPYFERGRMLVVYARNKRSALVMESNNDGRVITLRGGRLPDVTWLEACS